MQTLVTNEKIHVLGIAGSLRKGSYNRALLRAAQELAPKEMRITIFDNTQLSKIPLYDNDLREEGDPGSVQVLKQEIEQADALLFALPEYNHSFSGVLKNAVDWASRPGNASPLNGKPVAMLGAATGRSGTIRAQMHFRQVCATTNMLLLNKPLVQVINAADQFNSDGKLINQNARHFLGLLLEALLEWTRVIQYGKLVLEIGAENIMTPEDLQIV